MFVLMTNFLKANLREKYFLFWDWLFPVILMLGIAFFVRGQGYATFLLPGLVTFLLFQTLVYPIPFRMAQFRENGVLRLVAEEGSIKLFVISFLLSRIISSTLQVLTFLPIGILILSPPHINISVWVVLISFGGGLIGLSGFSLLVAVFARTVNSALGFAQLFYIGLSAVSGLFFPIEKSPAFLQVISQISPVTYLRRAFQYGLTGVGDTFIIDIAVLMTIGLSTAFTAIFIVNKELFKRLKP